MTEADDDGYFALNCRLSKAKSAIAETGHSADRVSTAGDPMLCQSLYEAANIMLGRVQRPFALQQWGQKIAESKGSKRARIAVVRKLAVLRHSRWLNETEFRWA